MTTENLTDDVVILPIQGMGNVKTIIVSKNKIDCVLGLEYDPSHCVIVVGSTRYSVNLSAEDTVKTIFGCIDEQGN